MPRLVNLSKGIKKGDRYGQVFFSITFRSNVASSSCGNDKGSTQAQTKQPVEKLPI